MSWFKAGDNMRINGDVLTRHNQGNNCETAYSTQIAVRGKHEWKIRIEKAAKLIVIGIASTTDHANTHFYHDKDPFNYAYYNDGRRVSQQVNYEKWPAEDNRVSYSEGDIVAVHLDMDEGTLGFSKNGLFLGNAFTQIARLQTYRLAVMLYKAEATIKMVSYEHREQTNEDDEDENAEIVDEQSQIVKQWLTGTVRLPQYVNIFLKNGFDDMMVIKELTLSDVKEMDSKNKIKLGHRKRIMMHVKRLNAVQ